MGGRERERERERERIKMGPVIKIDSLLENGRVVANGEMCRCKVYEGFVRCLKGNKIVIMNCTVQGGRATSSQHGYLNGLMSGYGIGQGLRFKGRRER